MDNTPRVSFVIPAYKRTFLREAIASILSQTCRDFELIVVDDCSPEDLKSVVDEFQDERLSFYRNEVNLGRRSLTDAWMKALSYARAEWCVLASDDDLYLPQYLERMLELVGKYPNCDLFGARSVEIDSHGNWHAVGLSRAEYESQTGALYCRLIHRCNQTLPEFLFRRSVLLRHGGFVSFPLAWFSDDATWAVMSEHGMVMSNEVLFCFRQSGLNISSRGTAVLAKFEAGCQYRAWLGRFLDGIRPTSRADEAMLTRLRVCFGECVNVGICFGCRAVGWSDWLRVLKAAWKDTRLRGRLLRERMPVTMAVLDHLRGRSGGETYGYSC